MERDRIQQILFNCVCSEILLEDTYFSPLAIEEIEEKNSILLDESSIFFSPNTLLYTKRRIEKRKLNYSRTIMLNKPLKHNTVLKWGQETSIHLFLLN